MTRSSGTWPRLRRGVSSRPRLLLAAGAVAAIVALTMSTGVAQAMVRGLLGGPGAPGNDALAAASVIDPTALSIDGTTAGASVETDENDVAAGDSTVWYSFTPVAAGTVYLSPSTDDPPAVRVYTGTAFPLTAVDADSASGAVAFDATAGTTYLLQVDASADPGEFDFSLIQPDSPPSGVVYPPAPSEPDPGDSGPSDTTAPTVTCTPPTDWTSSVEVECTATDSESGLAASADAAFVLIADVPAGASGSDVTTGTHEVCDTAGNCTTAGPFTGLEIDRSPPVVSCAPTSPNWIGAQAVIDCTATDAGSGLADPIDAAFTLTTSVPSDTASAAASFGTHDPICDTVGNCTSVTPPDPAHVDLAPPVVHCDAPPTGWQSGDTTVACTASDPDSGLADPSQASFTLSTAAGDATAGTDVQTGTVQVCDAVGNCATAGPVGGLNIDRAAPVVTCTPHTGWQAGTSAEIPCTATDPDSGLKDSADAAFTLTATIPAGQQSRTAASGSRQVCDAVGNCATAGPFTVPLDDQAPAITCQHTPADWQDDAVQVQCAVDDGDGSGVDSADSAFALTADIANGAQSDAVAITGRQVCDAVGNCASTPDLDSGKIDRITPQVVCDRPSGVHHAEVTVTCTSSDEGSGLADPALASFTLRTSVGAGNEDAAAETDTRTVCDLAGNCTVAGPVGPFDVDRSVAAAGAAPSLDLPGVVHVLSARPETAAGVNAGGAGAVPVPFDVPAATAAPGLSVRVGCNPEPGGLFPLGSTLVVCAATDDADRTTTKAYSVQVQLAPDLAPRTAYRIGGLAEAHGRGFAGGTVVRIELDGTLLAAVRASGTGVVGVALPIPADTPPGAHTLVLRGVAADGSPQLVVTPVTLTTDQQALAVAQPTGGTVRDQTTGAAPPPVTATLSGPSTGSASTTARGTAGTAAPATTARTTASGAAPSTSSTPATGPATGPSASGTSAPANGPATTSSPTPATPGSAPQQTFGGGPQQATTSSVPQEAGSSPQPTTPAATVAPTGSAPTGTGGLPAWLWWLIGAVVLCAVAAGVWLFLSRRR